MQEDYPAPAPAPMPTPAPIQAEEHKKSAKPAIITISVILLIVIGTFVAVTIMSNRPEPEGVKSDQLALAEDQIKIGYDGKAFMTADSLGDTIRNAAKSFNLVRTDNRKDIKDVEAFLQEKVHDYDGIGAEITKKTGIRTDTVFSLTPYENKTHTTTPIDAIEKFQPWIQIPCLFDNYKFSLDDHEFTCLESTREELEKLFGTLKPIYKLSETQLTATTVYKNHAVKISLTDNKLDHVQIYPLAKGDKLKIEYQNEYEGEEQPEYLELSFMNKKYKIYGNFGRYLYHLEKDGCHIYKAGKNEIEDIYSFLEQAIDEDEVTVNAHCFDSSYVDRQILITGYKEKGSNQKKYKDLVAYTSFKTLAAGQFYIENRLIIPLTDTRDKFRKTFSGLEEVKFNSDDTVGFKIKGFTISALITPRNDTIWEVDVYPENLFKNN